MTPKKYKSLLDWAKSIGYELHPLLERKKVDGVYGLYATDDIADGSILFKSPAYSTIQTDPNFNYDETLHKYVKLIHTIVVQYTMGEKCKYSPIFDAFETLNEMKEYSVYFCSSDEFKLIRDLSPLLEILIKNTINEIDKIVDTVYEIDNTLNKDDILWITLNWKSRAWDSGFIPILDLFNHSNKRGNLKYYIPETGDNYLIARGDYKKGEQVYDSYDINDVYHYAINYNFYDSSDWKYISLPFRMSFKITTDFDQKIFELVSKRFEVQKFKNGESESYRILSKGICFTEYGPTDELIELAKCFSYESLDDLNNGKFSYHKFDEVILSWLNLIESSNKVNSVEVPAYQTPRLKRFYDIQLDEFKIINACKIWLDVNSKSLKTKQLVNLRKLLFNSK